MKNTSRDWIQASPTMSGSEREDAADAGRRALEARERRVPALGHLAPARGRRGRSGARFSAAHASAAGPCCSDAASAMCSGARTGSARMRSHSSSGSGRARPRRSVASRHRARLPARAGICLRGARHPRPRTRRGRRRELLRRDGPRRARRPAADAGGADRPRAPAQPLPLPAGRAGRAARDRRARCCSCRRSPRRRSASTCGAAARSPSTCCWPAARPTSSTTARSSSPTARSGSSTGSTRSSRRRSAPRPRTRAGGRCS